MVHPSIMHVRSAVHEETEWVVCLHVGGGPAAGEGCASLTVAREVGARERIDETRSNGLISSSARASASRFSKSRERRWTFPDWEVRRRTNDFNSSSEELGWVRESDGMR